MLPDSRSTCKTKKRRKIKYKAFRDAPISGKAEDEDEVARRLHLPSQMRFDWFP